MRTVWKYVLDPNLEVVTLALPQGAIARHVEWQNGDLCLWATVDPTAKIEARRYRLTATGQQAPDGVYVGTAVGNQFVFHLWELQ